MFIYYKSFADDQDVQDALNEVHKALRLGGFSVRLSDDVQSTIFDKALIDMVPATLMLSESVVLEGTIAVDTLMQCSLVRDKFIVNPDYVRVHTSVDDRGLVVRMTNRNQFMMREELEEIVKTKQFTVGSMGQTPVIRSVLSVHQRGAGFEVSLNNSLPLLNSYDDRYAFRSELHLVHSLYTCIKREMRENSRVQIGKHSWISTHLDLPIVWQLRDIDPIS
jgi:hypothetical protein